MIKSSRFHQAVEIKDLVLNRSELHPAEKFRRRYSFGAFTLDMDEALLRRNGEEVTLRPKPLELLAYLVERHGRVVSKAELIEAVWPNTAITDNSLPQCILEVRRALSDDSLELIRTVSRRGYMFTAPVTMAILEFPSVANAAQAELGTPAALPRPRRTRMALVGAGLLLAALAGIAVAVIRGNHPVKREAK